MIKYTYLPAKHASMVTPDLCNRYSALSGCGTLWDTNWDRNPAVLYIVRLWNIVGHELVTGTLHCYTLSGCGTLWDTNW